MYVCAHTELEANSGLRDAKGQRSGEAKGKGYGIDSLSDAGMERDETSPRK